MPLPAIDGRPEPPWFRAAACRYPDAEPSRHECGSCEVRPQCLSWGLSAGEPTDAVFGGLDAAERAVLLEHFRGDVGASVRASNGLQGHIDIVARARAMARHPSTSPATRAQLALDFGISPC